METPLFVYRAQKRKISGSFDFTERNLHLPTFCPHCGSDADTGWKEGAEFTDLETPDYDEIAENEFGTDEYGNKKKKANPFAIAAAVIVALAFIAAMIF